MTRSPADRGRLRVLTHPAPFARHANSTPRQLAESLPADIEPIDFSWPRALSGRYDLFHIHWPDDMVNGRLAPLRVARALGVFAMLAVQAVRRIPRVWTVHNLEPHEKLGTLSRRAAEALQDADARVYMYEVARPADARPIDAVIRRGMQNMPISPEERSSRTPSGILNFGLIRPYKGIETLLDAYRGLPAETRPALTVAGRPAVASYAEEIRARAEGLDGVHLDFRWLDETELSERILDARLAVLPYRQIYNSGVVLNALLLRCPTLVPDSPTMRELRDEVGGDWVMLFDELTPDVIRDALERAERLDTAAPPDLGRRDWDVIGREYGELYRRTVDAGRRPRR